MRISDWSSDVCSSDLEATVLGSLGRNAKALQLIEKVDPKAYQATTSDPGRAAVLKAVKAQILLDMGERRQGESLLREALVEMRSEIGRASCRGRVGHTCRSRWSRVH